jgi:hypothetical protein
MKRRVHPAQFRKPRQDVREIRQEIPTKHKIRKLHSISRVIRKPDARSAGKVTIHGIRQRARVSKHPRAHRRRHDRVDAPGEMFRRFQPHARDHFNVVVFAADDDCPRR